MEKERYDALWDRHNDESVRIHSLFSDRVMTIRAIVVLPDYNVFRFQYQQERRTGVLNWNPRSGGTLVDVRDDLGTEYDEMGGTFGISRDSNRVNGDLDFTPAPPSVATWLDLIFRPDSNGESANQPRYILRIPLPLPSVTLAEWTSLIIKYWQVEGE